MPERQEEFEFSYNKPPEDRLPNQELMTTKEVADTLHIGTDHVRNLIDLGELDSFDVSSEPGVTRAVYRVLTRSVRAFMKRRREGAYE